MATVTEVVPLFLSRHMHFSEECLARGWTVTEPPNPFSGARVAEARVCEAGCTGSSRDLQQVRRGVLVPLTTPSAP